MRRFALTAICIVALASPSWALRYQAIELLGLPSAPDAIAWDINDSGQVSGYAAINQVMDPHVVRWDNGNGTPVDIGGGQGFGINNSGAIVGWSWQLTPS